MPEGLRHRSIFPLILINLGADTLGNIRRLGCNVKIQLVLYVAPDAHERQNRNDQRDAIPCNLRILLEL
jgi:hypothetical protein